MSIWNILFLIALLCLLIFLIITVVRVKATKCSQFGSNVFEAPNGNCYSCPSGYTVQSIPSTNTIQGQQESTSVTLINTPSSASSSTQSTSTQSTSTQSTSTQSTSTSTLPASFTLPTLLTSSSSSSPSSSSPSPSSSSPDTQDLDMVLNSLGVPICVLNQTAPMNIVRKTTTSANSIINDYVSATIVDTNMIEGESKGPFSQATLTDGTCPKGWIRDESIAANSLQACKTSCPSGSYPNVTNGICYSCPEGYSITNENTECTKLCPVGSYPASSSKNNAGANTNCYKCPTGYTRTSEPIESTKACIINCPNDAFTVNGQCQKCPSGYIRNTNANSLSPDEACYKPCSTNGSNTDSIFEDKATQTCYECPIGYIKDPNQNAAPFNNTACTQQLKQSADLITVVGNDGRLIEPSIVQNQLAIIKNDLM